jgi:CheY-like chemotaxis protein
VLIAVTGWGQAHDRGRTTEAGFDAHLVKPVSDTDVFGVLQSPQAGQFTTRARRA